MSPGTSDETVRDATGREWAAWFDALEKAEAGTSRDHKELGAWIDERHGDAVAGWWRQMMPGGWPRPSTLQVRLSDSGTGKTRVTFHHEHLPDADARDTMRTRWKQALAELTAEVA